MYDRIPEQPATPAVPLKVVAAEKTVLPRPAQPRPPIDATSQPQFDRRSPPPASPPPTPAPRSPAPIADPSRETVIREIVDSRVERRTIERRLESLAKERIVEQVERAPAPAISPVLPSPPAAATMPPAEQRRSVVVPEMKAAVPAKPVPMEAAPFAAPANVVHVTIGRVEVRATTPAPARQDPRNREPKLGLADYLRRRERA